MNITVLCGGVGAARFLVGLQEIWRDDPSLTISAIVNTADDDEIYGYYVCPDIDSILYHLSGNDDAERGWGRENDTFHFVETLRELGVDAWFNLGDRDLALNHLRTTSLNEGISLRKVTRNLCERLFISSIDVIPMCDEKVTTMITTDDGRTLRMQEYFVREQCRPAIRSIDFEGIPSHAHPDALVALEKSDVIIIAPSNPFLSINPILSLPDIKDCITRNKDKVVAISPIIRNTAVKGPLARNLADQGHKVSAEGIAELYKDIASIFIIDSSDEDLVGTIHSDEFHVLSTSILMDTLEARRKLAHFAIKTST